MQDFLYGIFSAGYFVAGLFFLKFWSRTHERLLVIFAGAFFLLALSQALLGITELPREEQTWLYLIRLCAFALIIFGIVSVNVGKKRP